VKRRRDHASYQQRGLWRSCKQLKCLSRDMQFLFLRLSIGYFSLSTLNFGAFHVVDVEQEPKIHSNLTNDRHSRIDEKFKS
jgi:hypothetical protein